MIGGQLAPVCLSGRADCGVIPPRVEMLRVAPCSSLLAAVADQEEAAHTGSAEKNDETDYGKGDYKCQVFDSPGRGPRGSSCYRRCRRWKNRGVEDPVRIDCERAPRRRSITTSIPNCLEDCK